MVAFAGQIKEEIGETQVTNALVDTIAGKKGHAKSVMKLKSTKTSASLVAVGAAAFTAVAFAIVA